MIVRIVLLVIIIFLSITVIQKIALALVGRKMMRLVNRRFSGRQVIMIALTANFFGMKSRGTGQIRGNGALVLTDDQLWFCLAAPTREIAIPIEQIKTVTTKRGHLGKTIFRPLLAVTFTNKGRDDEVAWYVNELPKWKTAIESVMNKAVRSPF